MDITADELDVVHGGTDLDTGLSFREAILDANAASGADTIHFMGVTGTITLASQIDVTDSVTIDGPGADQLTISGDGCTVFLSSRGEEPLQLAA